MVVTELPVDDPGHGFDEFVERHPQGTLFHLTRWRDLIRRHFPHRPRYLEARDCGKRVGVLPLFETRSLLSGKALVSVPYGVYGGPLTSKPEAQQALVARVREMVDTEGYRFAELRCHEQELADLPSTQLYVTFVRDLPGDPEECLAMIPRKSRATTRQARDRHQLKFVEDSDQLAEFHRLFVLNKRQLGSPAYSLRYFQTLMELPRNLVRMHGVYHNGQYIFGVISFLNGATWNPYYSGAMPGSERVGAANFAYWKLMELATSEGFTKFDFGRSRVHTGAYKFKKNMGFEPTPLAYRYLLGVGQSVPSVNPSNPKYSLPKKIISSLPYPLARSVGPALLRLVP